MAATRMRRPCSKSASPDLACRHGNCDRQCDKNLDFDAVIRDPAHRNQIAPRLDSGDGIHPSGEGYRRLAASIPLDLL